MHHTTEGRCRDLLDRAYRQQWLATDALDDKKRRAAQNHWREGVRLLAQFEATCRDADQELNTRIFRTADYQRAVEAWLEAELKAPSRSLEANQRAYSHAMDVAAELEDGTLRLGLEGRVLNGYGAVLLCNRLANEAEEKLNLACEKLESALGDTAVWAQAKFRLALARHLLGRRDGARALRGVTDRLGTGRGITRHHLAGICFSIYLQPNSSRTMLTSAITRARRQGLTRVPEWWQLWLLRINRHLYARLLDRQIRKMEI